jgi:hypothetical protein
MFLVIPKEAGLKAVGIGSWNIPIKRTDFNSGSTVVGCLTEDCRNIAVTLDIAPEKPFDVLFGERRFGLPGDGKKLLDARPDTAVPSQLGDGTVLVSKVRVAG